jgi:predicted dienelactone hydrolase
MRIPLACVTLLTLSIGCLDSNAPEILPFEPSGPEAAPPPSEMGPYPVGVRTITFVDHSRETPGQEGPRTLVCEVWYPATEATRDLPGEDYVVIEQVPQDVRDMYPGIDAEALGALSTTAVRDANARLNEKFPLIVFSHGKGGIRMQSTFYTVALASHGYVVISPDHEGDTLVNLLLDGDVEITSTVDSFILRPQDASFLIRELDNLDESDPLKPILDMDRVGITGHSFGALTSFRTAGMDARIDALVAHTPVGIGLVNADLEVKVEDFNIPTMIASGGMDETLPADLHAESMWEAMPEPKFHLHLQRGGHFTYSDLCIMDVPKIQEALGDDVDVEKVLNDGCGDQNTPPELARPAINHYSIGFFNSYLRDSAATLDLMTEDTGKEIAPGELTFDVVR